MVARKTRGDQQKSFEELMRELQDIVSRLESRDLPLEQSIELFEKGMGLAAEGTLKLDEAEKKVQLLIEGDGKEKRVPFPAPEEG